MIDKNILSKILSVIYTGLFIALFIYLLPVLLIIGAVLISIIIIGFFVVKYLIKKEKIKMKFNYPGGSQRRWDGEEEEAEEIHEMKDVTPNKTKQ